MGHWTDLSIQYASQRNYLDELFKIYPTITNSDVNAVTIAILDGVLYINSNNKMYKNITTTYKNYNIFSALVLREFLYSL